MFNSLILFSSSPIVAKFTNKFPIFLLTALYCSCCYNEFISLFL
nr:MAG TPA: hypothetical protein [Bacteriophage sp.]